MIATTQTNTIESNEVGFYRANGDTLVIGADDIAHAAQVFRSTTGASPHSIARERELRHLVQPKKPRRPMEGGLTLGEAADLVKLQSKLRDVRRWCEDHRHKTTAMIILGILDDAGQEDE